MGDEEDTDDPKAMQFAKMDVPEAYMTTNDEELVMKMEQVRSTNIFPSYCSSRACSEVSCLQQIRKSVPALY